MRFPLLLWYFSRLQSSYKMLKCTMIVNQENAEDGMSAGSGICVKVNQNNNIGKIAQEYLNLCGNLDKGVLQKDQLAKDISLPADLMAVEKGVAVLCDAYDCALKENKGNVCADIKEELKKMSGFYQEKVADAYFSACNILLDADGMDKNELKVLSRSCHSLQNVYDTYLDCSFGKSENDLPNFFEKVDTYSRIFDLENPNGSAKKVGNKTTDRYIDFVSHQRTM